MRCLRPTHEAIITTNRVSNGRNRCREALVSFRRQMGAASQEGAEITDLGGKQPSERRDEEVEHRVFRP